MSITVSPSNCEAFIEVLQLQAAADRYRSEIYAKFDRYRANKYKRKAQEATELILVLREKMHEAIYNPTTT